MPTMHAPRSISIQENNTPGNRTTTWMLDLRREFAGESELSTPLQRIVGFCLEFG